MLIIVASGGALYGQEKKSRKQRRAEQTEIRVKKLIDSQNYIFTGGNNMETGGAPRGSEYVIVTKERLEISMLPQYSKESNNSTRSNPSSYREFEYKIEDSRKGGWDVYIKIEIERMKYVFEMFLTISPNGSAVLTLKQHPWSSVSTYIGRINGPKPNGKF